MVIFMIEWLRPSSFCKYCQQLYACICCNVKQRISLVSDSVGHFGGADTLWVSIEFDMTIQWFLIVSGSLRWC